MLPRIYKFDSGALAYVKVSRLKLGGLIFAFSIIGLAVGYAISAFAKYEESAPEYEELIVLINEYENENVSPEASAFVSAIDKARETNNGSVEYILDEKEEVNGQ